MSQKPITKDIENLHEQAHFAIHIDTTNVSVLPKLKHATDGALWRIIRLYVRKTPHLTKDAMWTALETCFNDMRNYYAHPIRGKLHTELHAKLEKKSDNYSKTRDFLQFAYDNIPDKNANTKKTLFDNNRITRDGIIFFACIMSTRQLANEFIGGISGYKRNNGDYKALRNITMYYTYRDGYNLHATGTGDTTQDWRKAFEILDYIRKPVLGTIKATEYQDNRKKKDECDVHSGKYDVRTSKNLFPYFATHWLEKQYADDKDKDVNISFLRIDGNTETQYKPNGKNAKKSRLHIIDKHNDTEHYDINLPLHMPYRGTAVMAVIKIKQATQSVLLSDRDLFYMVLLKLDKDKKLPLQAIQNHDKKSPRTKKPISPDDATVKRLDLIIKRWENCDTWHTREKINRIFWAFQNLIFKEKITDTKIADNFRHEIINYNGRKSFKRFMDDNKLDSDYKFPPNNRLNDILPDKGMGYECLLSSVKYFVKKWCDDIKSEKTVPESPDTIQKILNIRPADKPTDSTKTASFIHPDFWKNHIKTNETYKHLVGKNITGYNSADFYHIDTHAAKSDLPKPIDTSDVWRWLKSKKGDSSLPKTIYTIYLQDMILYTLAQDYLRQHSDSKQSNDKKSDYKKIELLGKDKRCKITFTPKEKDLKNNNIERDSYEITMPLHYIGKSYVLDTIPSGSNQAVYLHSLFTQCKNNGKNNPTMDDIITAKRELQKGMHDFVWRWLRCEQKLMKKFPDYETTDEGQMKIECTLKRVENFDNAKTITKARNKCLHSNIWNIEHNPDNEIINKKEAFIALQNLEKELGFEYTEKKLKKK